MKIDVRHIGKYREATFDDRNTRIETGFMSEAECRVLAKTLRDAADDLMRGYNEESKS